MRVKPIVRFGYQLFIETLLASAGFVAGNKEDGLALGVEAKATRHSPSAALKRSSFIFG
jgi:hypothetical protein